jgi:hypothetical protein
MVDRQYTLPYGVSYDRITGFPMWKHDFLNKNMRGSTTKNILFEFVENATTLEQCVMIVKLLEVPCGHNIGSYKIMSELVMGGITEDQLVWMVKLLPFRQSCGLTFETIIEFVLDKDITQEHVDVASKICSCKNVYIWSRGIVMNPLMPWGLKTTIEICKLLLDSGFSVDAVVQILNHPNITHTRVKWAILLFGQKFPEHDVVNISLHSATSNETIEQLMMLQKCSDIPVGKFAPYMLNQAVSPQEKEIAYKLMINTTKK